MLLAAAAALLRSGSLVVILVGGSRWAWRCAVAGVGTWLAGGCVLVTADAHALPHLVRAGRNGALVPPGDLAALATAVAPLLTDAGLRRAAGAESRAVAAGHDLERTLATFEALYAPVRPDATAAGEPAAADDCGGTHLSELRAAVP
ncbi:MAG: glycosyltransferase [Kineosporiaceae bacterium]